MYFPSWLIGINQEKDVLPTMQCFHGTWCLSKSNISSQIFIVNYCLINKNTEVTYWVLIYMSVYKFISQIMVFHTLHSYQINYISDRFFCKSYYFFYIPILYHCLSNKSNIYQQHIFPQKHFLMLVFKNKTLFFI